jgi:hypothetical protein
MNPPALLTKLVGAWPAIRRDRFTLNCCLNASRVWIEALAVVMPKARVRPLTVHAVASNAPAQRLMLDPDCTAERWRAEGAHLIDVGEPSADRISDGWPGHLVLVFNNRWLIDPSAEQMARPTLPVPPVIVSPVSKRIIAGDAALALRLPDEASMVFYQARPEDRSYEDMPGFQRSPWNTAAAAILAGACALACGGGEFTAPQDTERLDGGQEGSIRSDAQSQDVVVHPPLSGSGGMYSSGGASGGTPVVQPGTGGLDAGFGGHAAADSGGASGGVLGVGGTGGTVGAGGATGTGGAAAGGGSGCYYNVCPVSCPADYGFCCQPYLCGCLAPNPVPGGQPPVVCQRP